MAKSFRELGRKAEELIEQGREADRRVQSCQARVDSASAGVAAARRRLSDASETDEDGNPRGDVAQAAAQLRMAENMLAASRRALTEANGEAERIKERKKEHVREIELHNQVERSNLEKLRRLRSSAFSENSAALTEGIAQRLNEADDARVALLRSMGIEAAPDHVSAGSDVAVGMPWQGIGFSPLDTSGQAQRYSGGGSEGTGSSGAAAPIGGGMIGVEYGKGASLVITAQEKRERGAGYIKNILGEYKSELIDRGIAEDEDLDRLMSVLNDHYHAELERDIAGLPNQLYEDPNFDTITKLGVPFVLGMYDTASKSRHKDVIRLYEKFADKVTVCDTGFLGCAHYAANEGVYMFKEQVASGDGALHKPYQTAFHEFGHNIDYLIGNGSPISESWGNNELYRAIREDFAALKGSRTDAQFISDFRTEVKKNNWTHYQIGSVSDIIESMTGIDYPLGSGHDSPAVRVTAPDGTVIEKKVSYWHNRLPNKEFFAETLDGAAANEESYTMLRRFFPRAVSVVHKIIGGIQ